MKGVYIWGGKNRIPTYVLLTNIILGKLKFNYMIYGYMIFELRALLVSKIFHIECHVKPTVVSLIFLCINFGGFIKKHSSICCQSSYQYKKLVEIALH